MHSSDVQEPFYFYVQEPYYPYGWMVCVCVCAYQQALKFWYVMNTHFVLENKHNTDITKIWLHLLNPNLSVSQISLGWFFFLLKYLFVYLAGPGLTCGMWDLFLAVQGILVPQLGIKLRPPALRSQNLATGPPGKAHKLVLKEGWCYHFTRHLYETLGFRMVRG